jgi:hypothetical protein
VADRFKSNRGLVGMSGRSFVGIWHMAIYRMIRESVFEPEAIERMTSAYEHALKVLRLTDRNDPITELVARKIIDIAEVGEPDPDRLCARALEALGIGLDAQDT